MLRKSDYSTTCTHASILILKSQECNNIEVGVSLLKHHLTPYTRSYVYTSDLMKECVSEVYTNYYYIYIYIFSKDSICCSCMRT